MFIEERINDNLVIYSTSGGPSYNTTVASVSSGKTQRNSNWSESLASFDIGERVCLLSELNDLLDFMHICEGQAIGFRFKDWGDFEVTVDRGVFGQLSPTTFQLYKRYKRANYFKDKKISKPVAGTVRVYLDGVLIPTAAVDTTTGIVTLPVPTSDAGPYDLDKLSWSGEYDLPVRFTVDGIKHQFQAMDNGQRLFYVYSLPVVEDRL